MTGLVTSAALVLALGTGWEPGHGTRYAEHVMHEVAERRGLPVADCMIAYDRAPLGTFVWVRGQTGRLLWCQVTDESKGRADTPGSDKWRHIRANLVEFDWASARAMCVDFAGPWRDCPVWVLRHSGGAAR